MPTGSYGRYSSAKVVFPAPFGPAITMILRSDGMAGIYSASSQSSEDIGAARDNGLLTWLLCRRTIARSPSRPASVCYF